MTRLIAAFQFLTIIPLRVKGDVSEKDMAGGAVFFPLVGAFQGLIMFTSLLLIKIFPSDITACLVLSMLIMSNGGFHLDGLSDTFDALAVKASGDWKKDIEKRLSVMKDSSIGAIGVVAAVITILLKYLFISRILEEHLTLTACSVLFLMPVFSKWVMVIAMYHGVSARKDGLGRIFIDNIKINTVIISSLLVLLIYALVFYLNKASGLRGMALFFILSALFYVMSVLSARFFKRRFGGITGDTMGAAAEVSEIVFLMVTYIWLRQSI